MIPTSINIFSSTDKGLEREHNEDYHIFCSDLSSPDVKWEFFTGVNVEKLGSKGALLVLADGMGGANAGEVASSLAIEGIKNYFSEVKISNSLSSTDIKSILHKAIAFANRLIIEHQKKAPETKGMGTTLVLGWILDNKLYVAWVGDSRCYKYNINTGLMPLSKDHSLVQEMVNKGQLTYEQAFYHPQSNIITQSLGDGNRLPEPGFVTYNLQEKDRILLCSDGLNGMIQDSDIGLLLSQIPNIETCTRELISAANQAGGHDNTTIILCDIISVDAIPNIEQQSKDIHNEAPKAFPKKLINLKTLIAASLIFFIIGFVLAVFLLKSNSEKKELPKVDEPKEAIISRDNIESKDNSNKIEENPYIPFVEKAKMIQIDFLKNKYSGSKTNIFNNLLLDCLEQVEQQNILDCGLLRNLILSINDLKITNRESIELLRNLNDEVVKICPDIDKQSPQNDKQKVSVKTSSGTANKAEEKTSGESKELTPINQVAEQDCTKLHLKIPDKDTLQNK